MNKNLKKCLKNIVLLKNRAKKGRYLQNMMLSTLLISIIFLLVTNLNIFKILSLLFAISTLCIIFYINNIIDPLWEEEIKRYAKLLNKQHEK